MFNVCTVRIFSTQRRAHRRRTVIIELAMNLIFPIAFTDSMYKHQLVGAKPREDVEMCSKFYAWQLRRFAMECAINICFADPEWLMARRLNIECEIVRRAMMPRLCVVSFQ